MRFREGYVMNQISELERGKLTHYTGRYSDYERLKEEAKEKCSDYIKSFAECAHEQGLLVVLSCRDKLKAMNSCMAVHNSEEAWQEYKNTFSGNYGMHVPSFVGEDFARAAIPRQLSKLNQKTPLSFSHFSRRGPEHCEHR